MSKIISKSINTIAHLLYKQGFQIRNAKKRALVSYVATLPFWNNRYYMSMHNSNIKAYLLCKTLNSLGYSVDLRKCDDIDAPTDRTYDFFLGHTKTFLCIKNKIDLKGKSVLLVTGSAPEFGNAAQQSRAEELYRRRGIRLPVHSENIVRPAKELHFAADHILMLGNSFVRSTWYPECLEKYTLINNVSTHTLDLGPERPNNYLFFSSTGQVHRGLDILLDVFSNRDEHLHICSAVLKETDFVSAFKEELFYRKNIHTHGYVNTSSKRFQRILAECRFVILPSCSEGQSSSVINAMFNGLLPVVTNNVGLPSVSDCGYLLNDISIESMHNILDHLGNISIDEYRTKRNNLPTFLQNFSPENFQLSVKNFLVKEVGL